MQITRSHSSPNYNSRPSGVTPFAIVLHSTEGRWSSDLGWLCNPDSGVSCHYVIAPDGEVFQIVDDAKRAWHAGTGTYQGYSDWNSISIGIEISHMQGDAYPAAQLDATAALCSELIYRYGIQQHMIAAHRWIAPDRKIDPTNISDAQLHDWIAAFYQTSWATLWGWPNYEDVETFAIPTMWREEYLAGRPLGAPLWPDERGRPDGRVDMTFPEGFITYAAGEGARVWRH